MTPRAFSPSSVFLFVVAAAALAFAARVDAQTLKILRETGPRANRVNLVIVGEGYVAAEQTKFDADAAAQLQAILTNESWVRFADQINAYGIFVASNQSGADIPSQGIVRDTYFNATFSTAGIERLLTVSYSRVTNAITPLVPDHDVVVVLVNSTHYGGSGGAYATTSLHPSASEILLHELGHSFARLVDEYIESTTGNPQFFPGAPNGTNQTARDKIPWNAFIPANRPLPTTTPNFDTNFISLFEGMNAYPTGVYRPTYESKMRSLGQPFGAVNNRAFATQLHRLNLNNASAPPTLAEQPAALALRLGRPGTLRARAAGTGPFTYQWSRDGLFLPGATLPEFAIAAMSAANAGSYAVEVTNSAGAVTSASAGVTLAASETPLIVTPPAGAALAPGQSTTLGVVVDGAAPLAYQWHHNGTAVPGATGSTFTVSTLSPALVGAYTVVVTNAFGSATSAPAIVSLLSPAKILGAATEVGPNIQHPNGNVYDQLLLTGAAATLVADAGQITRVSYIDLDDDIVQVEFSGPGSLTLTLENASGPSAPLNYNQPDVPYMKGHATLTLAGATEATHLSLFTVGTLTAVNQALFKAGVAYDGIADLALLSVTGANGAAPRLGSLRAANANFFHIKGPTGVNAPGLRIGGPALVHAIAANDQATPVLLTGPIDTGRISIAGSDMLQPNGRAVQVGAAQSLLMSAGTTSHNVAQPAQPNRARYERDGVDVTTQLVTGP